MDDMVPYEYALKLYNELSPDQKKQLPEFTPASWNKMWEMFQKTDFPEKSTKKGGAGIMAALGSFATCNAVVFAALVAIKAAVDVSQSEQYLNTENFLDFYSGKCEDTSYCRSRHHHCTSSFFTLSVPQVNPYCDFSSKTSGAVKFMIDNVFDGSHTLFFESFLLNTISETASKAFVICTTRVAGTFARAYMGGKSKHKSKRKMKRTKRTKK